MASYRLRGADEIIEHRNSQTHPFAPQRICSILQPWPCPCLLFDVTQRAVLYSLSYNPSNTWENCNSLLNGLGIFWAERAAEVVRSSEQMFTPVWIFFNHGTCLIIYTFKSQAYGHMTTLSFGWVDMFQQVDYQITTIKWWRRMKRKKNLDRFRPCWDLLIHDGHTLRTTVRTMWKSHIHIPSVRTSGIHLWSINVQRPNISLRNF